MRKLASIVMIVVIIGWAIAMSLGIRAIINLIPKEVKCGTDYECYKSTGEVPF